MVMKVVMQAHTLSLGCPYRIMSEDVKDFA